MAYKYDSDLEFLRGMKSEDLNDLVEVLTKDKDGNPRLTEDLTSNDLFKRFYPDHKEYIDLILAELQTFGGNSFANMFRGGGVLYKEILCDVCDKMKVNYNKNSSTERIEGNMLMKIFEDAVEKMSPEELKEIVKDLNLKTTNFTAQGITAALQLAINRSGILAYKIALIVANAVWKALFGHGLKLAANAGITRSIGVFAGPIGWIITGLWTAIDLAGPAYRVTIPAVIQIAYLRQLSYQEKNEEKK